jgi:GNAT superfamily N-acetyltransferase
MSGPGPWYSVSEDDDPRDRSAYEADLRAVYEALQRISLGQAYERAASSLQMYELVADVDRKLDDALEVVDAELGPVVSWRSGPAPASYDWRIEVLQVDFDEGVQELPEAGWDGLPMSWEDTGFWRAAVAYRRECRWDHSPDAAGVWVIAVAPLSNVPDGDEAIWAGNLIGFIVVHDRDGDGEYESIAHMWTAGGWRGRGVATAMLQHARDQFPIRSVEAPYTEAGAGLLASAAPDLR